MAEAIKACGKPHKTRATARGRNRTNLGWEWPSYLPKVLTVCRFIVAERSAVGAQRTDRGALHSRNRPFQAMSALLMALITDLLSA